ncbi:response regulator transcription factor [Carboxydochorda subterranea]|uniref:Response regulator transcription factor n=1 Tax=Carboxydichorda subterranea TaxID=3109565 RepID=A0ABZ1C096_9FIRM|nr:response regulator transcription factor [Limnochorda sp. L945t]WRP18364.1 response regulator transcription factor [Limnochorda sp. L945t]
MDSERILVVDDEPHILKAVSHRLERSGYQVEVAADGEEALEKFDRFRPDLVVLDLMLPRLDGYEVCHAIRERSNTPIIILSARSEEPDRLTGFWLGADDYLTKPFSLAELVLRIQAVLRRARPDPGVERAGASAAGERPDTGATEGGAPAAGTEQVLHFEGLTIDRQCRMVWRRGQPVDLTAREFDLLWLLASHPMVVFTRDQILDRVWQSDYAGDLANVTVCISRLREKLEEDPLAPQFIQTVRGVGYRFRARPIRPGSPAPQVPAV